MDEKIERLRLKILDKVPDNGQPAFTDLELEGFLTKANGNIPLAAGDALTEMLKDRNRLTQWAKHDTKIDYDILRKDIADVAQSFYNQGVSEAHDANSD